MFEYMVLGNYPPDRMSKELTAMSRIGWELVGQVMPAASTTGAVVATMRRELPKH